MLIKLFKIIVSIFFIPLWHLQKLIKRDSKTWVFGSWNGEKYNDNSMYFFEYVNRFTKIKAYWITKSKNVYKELKNRNFNVEYANSFKGIYITLIAKYFFISWGKTDINNYFTNGGLLFNLWHGNPIKNRIRK